MLNTVKFWKNPFEYIGGFKALWIGLLLMCVTSVSTYFLQFRFDGLVDYHGYPERSYAYLADLFVSWLLLSIITIIVGRIARKKFRIIDVLGMYALCFSVKLVDVGVTSILDLKSLNVIFQEDVSLTELPKLLQPYIFQLVVSGLLSLGTMVVFIWYSFQAFKINMNFKASTNVGLFFVIFLLTEIIAIMVIRNY